MKAAGFEKPAAFFVLRRFFLLDLSAFHLRLVVFHGHSEYGQQDHTEIDRSGHFEAIHFAAKNRKQSPFCKTLIQEIGGPVFPELRYESHAIRNIENAYNQNARLQGQRCRGALKKQR